MMPAESLNVSFVPCAAVSRVQKAKHLYVTDAYVLGPKRAVTACVPVIGYGCPHSTVIGLDLAVVWVCKVAVYG